MLLCKVRKNNLWKKDCQVVLVAQNGLGGQLGMNKEIIKKLLSNFESHWNKCKFGSTTTTNKCKFCSTTTTASTKLTLTASSSSSCSYYYVTFFSSAMESSSKNLEKKWI